MVLFVGTRFQSGLGFVAIVAGLYHECQLGWIGGFYCDGPRRSRCSRVGRDVDHDFDRSGPHCNLVCDCFPIGIDAGGGSSAGLKLVRVRF